VPPPPLLGQLPVASVQLSVTVPFAQPVSRGAYVAKPKFTSPANAPIVFVIAHFASLSRVGSNPHEFFVAVLAQEVFGHVVAGFVQLLMLPDVSTASMK